MSRWTVFAPFGALVLACCAASPVGAQAAERTANGPAGAWLRPAAYLGVTLRDVGRDDVSRLKLEAERGAIVDSVRPDTPASKAGLKAGDVIVGYQGETVQSMAQLARLVAETPPGREVKLDLVRDGAPTALSATLDEGGRRLAGDFDMPVPPMPGLPPDFDPEQVAGKARALMRRHGWLDTGPPRLGITFQEISGQLASYFKLDADSGLLVASVQKGSPADEAGLRAGDVILRVAGREVREPEALREEVARAEPGQELKLTVQRDGKPLDLSVRLRDAPRRERPLPTT